jgi:hypothetical protein
VIPPRPVQTQRDRVIERATTQKPNYGIPTNPFVGEKIQQRSDFKTDRPSSSRVQRRNK